MNRREFISDGVLAAVASAVRVPAPPADAAELPSTTNLKDGWWLQSCTLVEQGGEAISRSGFVPGGWYKVSIPSTVLSGLVKNGVYPDPRIGLNAYQMPDSSDEFNKRYDLGKHSHLPDKQNPWRVPYWYRTEFNLPPVRSHLHAWLNFNCINYRAEIWLNGVRIADKDQMVGMFQRFRFNVTTHIRAARNVLAVKIFPVDHPGVPDKQVEILGKPRGYQTEISRDVTEIVTVGYDCMMTVPDRNMGICQEVFIDWTGPVDVRHPFVITDLPLPDSSRATLAISAELTNVSSARVNGVLNGQIAGNEVRFAQQVELGPYQTKLVSVEPKPVMVNPRLWWPISYGEQHLYTLHLHFEAGGAVSAKQTVTFGVREVTTEIHELDGSHGRRILVNGEKILCRGGYVQPELLLDWDGERLKKEIRYYADANINLIYFEDIPNPPDEFLDECDRRGILFGNCFYSCFWLCPGPSYQPRQGEKASCSAPRDYPDDFDLLEKCTIDVLKRYRNHPSLVMYMAMNEADTREQVYKMWRRHILELDGTRFWIPSAYFPDARNKEAPEWFKQDLPTGMNDWPPKSYGWKEPVTYFQWVRNDRQWMFKMESGSASLPPVSSLRKFLDNAGAHNTGEKLFPLTPAWAHHGANSYFAEYDAAIRDLHGEPESVTDYCWKGHLLTADQHRAFYEAVNHRMWEISSGFTEWKINSSYPDVQWQNFDYYFKPVVSHFYIKKACEPLHVQMDLIDHTVTVINTRLQAQANLEVSARVFDLHAKLLRELKNTLGVAANTYREAFSISNLTSFAPFVFVKLELRDVAGRLVSENFYWLRGQGVSDYKDLQRLPLVKLEATSRLEEQGDEKWVRVTIRNPSAQIAFFTQLALTAAEVSGHRNAASGLTTGDEILPVLWDDNYFSLLPGDQREITARLATSDLHNCKPVLEVGGWNIQTGYRCRKLQTSTASVHASEPFTVTADIGDTFLDGSRVSLLADGETAQTKWAWARGVDLDRISFKLSLSGRGKHRLAVGTCATEVVVV